MSQESSTPTTKTYPEKHTLVIDPYKNQLPILNKIGNGKNFSQSAEHSKYFKECSEIEQASVQFYR